MSAIDGLVTGLDTSSIISQLMQLERIPQRRLENRANIAKSASTELDGLRLSVVGIRTAAATMKYPSAWQPLSATSSSESVKVAATSGASVGNLAFNVTKVASGEAIYSNQTVATTNSVVAAGGSVFSYSGTKQLGFDKLAATGLNVGDVSFEVTQASAAAKTTASTLPQPVPLTIDGTNNQLMFSVAGAGSISLSIGTGEYESAEELAAAINSAIAATPAAKDVVKAGVEGGKLTLSTIAEGSDNTIEVTGGSAAAELGWNLTEGAATGTDGIVTVDGVANTITDTTKDTAVTLNAGAGSITASMSGPMRLGTANTEQVSFGSGTLSEVVSAINNADGLGYGAVAVNTGSGYRLQLTANNTGAAATVGIDQSMFTGLSGTPGVDMFSTLTAAQDAEITFQGLNPYSITSSSNTFKDLMSGVSATVSAVTTTPVTISSTKDTAKVADAVESLVKDLSTLFARIKQGTRSDVEAGTTGLLSGSSAPRRVQSELQRALLNPVAGNSIISGGAAGISLNGDGTIKFDRAAFISAYEADPDGMQRLFVAPAGEEESNPGILDRISEVAKNASSFGTGYLATAKEAKDNQVNTFNRQVDAYEVRMERKQAALQRQYAALEVALGSLNNQSNWLAGQLGSLGSYSS